MATINKIILTLYLFTFASYAIDLEISSNKTYGNISLQIIDIKNNSVTIKTNSNIFNVNGDKSFGVYKVKANFLKTIEDLKKIKSRITKLDQTLSLSNSSLSSLYKGSLHDFNIRFDDKIISSNSPFYIKLKELINLIISSPNKQIIKNVKLEDSKLTITENKKTKISVYNKEKNCFGTAKSGVCKIQDLGFISL